MKSRRPAVGLGRLERDADRLDDARRRVLADWCRLVGHRMAGTAAPMEPRAHVQSPSPTDSARTPAKTNGGNATPVDEAVARLGLPPRARQVLLGLLSGASEKQIARQLSISPHTVHTYVKQLHKRLGVASRGELLSRFLVSERPG